MTQASGLTQMGTERDAARSSSKELQSTAVSLVRWYGPYQRYGPLINSNHLQPYLFVKVEEHKSIHSFQELHPQTLQSTNKRESKEGNVQLILMHHKHTTVNKRLISMLYLMEFKGYTRFLAHFIKL